jgi:hypothetical protein
MRRAKWFVGFEVRGYGDISGTDLGHLVNNSLTHCIPGEDSGYYPQNPALCLVVGEILRKFDDVHGGVAMVVRDERKMGNLAQLGVFRYKSHHGKSTVADGGRVLSYRYSLLPLKARIMSDSQTRISRPCRVVLPAGIIQVVEPTGSPSPKRLDPSQTSNSDAC